MGVDNGPCMVEKYTDENVPSPRRWKLSGSNELMEMVHLSAGKGGFF